MSNPVDEILEELEEKTAAFYGGMNHPSGMGGALSAAKGALHQIRDPMLGAVGMAVAGAAVGAGMGAVKEIWNAATKTRDFRAMLQHNQDLAAHEDQKAVGMAFTTLRTFSPQFSKDPMVAGSYVRRMVESPMGTGAIVNEALGAHKNIPSRTVDLATSAAQSGLKYKDSKDIIRDDFQHQERLERMKNMVRLDADEDAIDRGLKKRP